MRVLLEAIRVAVLAYFLFLLVGEFLPAPLRAPWAMRVRTSPRGQTSWGAGKETISDS